MTTVVDVNASWSSQHIKLVDNPDGEMKKIIGGILHYKKRLQDFKERKGRIYE